MTVANNVDAEEIAKFSTDWWNLQGTFQTLHAINPLRLNYINEKTGLLNKTVLDVGCGGGILAESMAKLGAKVTGIDMNKDALTAALSHQNQSGVHIEYLLMTAEQLAEKHAGQFDVVTCLELLEHVPDPTSLITACAQLVKPNGHVFFSTINRNVKSYLFAIIGVEYFLKLLPKETHHFAKFIRPSELAEWARKSELTPQEMVGITYNIFTKQYALTADVSVNYLMFFQRGDLSLQK